MRNTMTQILKKTFWYLLANSTIKDIRNTLLNEELFLRDVKNDKIVTLHLSKKHFPFIVEKVLNQMLANQHQSYIIATIRYHFHGMDVIISQK